MTATLTVVLPKNAIANNSRAIDYVKTYTGTSNDPKINSRYKGNCKENKYVSRTFYGTKGMQ